MTAWREVWITGVGAVSVAGIGTGALGDFVVAGVAPGNGGAAPALPASPRTRRLDRSGALFFTAAEEAWHAAGLPDTPPEPGRTALLEGSSLGPMAAVAAAAREALEEHARPRPSALLRLMPGAGGATFAAHHRIRGPVLHLSAASVSGLCALGEAYRKVASSEVDLAVAGGAEAPLDPAIVAHFRAAGILGTACRPFDADRDGTALSEGAGVWIVEDALHADARGAVPLARIRGYGHTGEAYDLLRPDPTGTAVASAVGRALDAAGPVSLGWIKAHGTGTRIGDPAEVAGLRQAIGPQISCVWLSSLKGALGHALGASGAVEGVAAVLTMRRCVVPPTVGLRSPDSLFADLRLPRRPELLEAPAVLLIAESFGGRAAALVVERTA